MSVKELNISPVGRVEGDLDVKVYIENGKVTRHIPRLPCSAVLRRLWPAKTPSQV